MTAIFSHDYQVYINHTDAGGIVYHANHLSFYEHCRRDWFASIGLNAYFFSPPQSADNFPHHFVVTEAQLKYQQPILLDQSISVRIDAVSLRAASLIFAQSIHSSDGRLLSQARIVIACVQNELHASASINAGVAESDGKNEEATPIPPLSVRPVRLPAHIRDAISNALAST